jgi:hypothetical protein
MKELASICSTVSQSRPAPSAAFLSIPRSFVLALGAFTFFFCCTLRATGAPVGTIDDDVSAGAPTHTNARAVRLSSSEGEVRVVQDGQVIADPAYANLPLFGGSQIITGNDGRAEIQLEDGSVARLSPNSTLTFSVLEKQGTGSKTAIVLNGGLAYFELQPSTADHGLSINYGSASFSASSFSVLRLTIDTPPGELAVFSGNVHLERGDSLQLDVHGGESVTLDAGDQTRYNLAETIQPDSWDSWNADRDQVLNAASAEQTAATGNYPSGVGMSDLDANGNWYDVPGQGYVWSPFDAQAGGAGWDPYGYGRWVSYPGYGYVWNSGYDWGYAPFQCGLWNFYDNFGWGWMPGGGCNPWWGLGGWGYNIGNGPRGYLPPRRPIPGPIRPRPVGGRGLVASNVIPVDRRSAKTVNMVQYARPAQPVTIAGHTVQPMRPVAPRPGYERSTAIMANRPAGSYFPSSSHPASSYAGQPGSRPASSFSGARATAPSAASHASYSGGGGGSMGGGGGHAAGGGGGGGGGGGSHK